MFTSILVTIKVFLSDLTKFMTFMHIFSHFQKMFTILVLIGISVMLKKNISLKNHLLTVLYIIYLPLKINWLPSFVY